MGRCAWVLEVRPGCEDAYKKRHDEFRPERLEVLLGARIRNYNILRRGLMLFGYFKKRRSFTHDRGSKGRSDERALGRFDGPIIS
jgi:L-rhamnose mutarotase